MTNLQDKLKYHLDKRYNFLHDGEVWKTIPDYSYYEVSNYGRIRSLDKYINHNYGGKALRKGKVISQSKDERGYLLVGLTGDNGVKKSIKVSRIVANVFIENPNDKPQVNHINGIKTDNTVKNLEWNTAGENVRHSWSTGLSNKGRKYEYMQKRLYHIMMYAMSSDNLVVSTPKGFGKVMIDDSRIVIRYENKLTEQLVKSLRMYGDNLKMCLYSLDAITRPIKVESYNDGKEFVPIDEIQKLFGNLNLNWYADNECIYKSVTLIERYRWTQIDQLPFRMVEKLISWHFWIGDQSLFETGEILDKENYES